MSRWSLTCRKSVFKWQQTSKHFKVFYPQNGERTVSVGPVTSFHPVYCCCFWSTLPRWWVCQSSLILLNHPDTVPVHYTILFLLHTWCVMAESLVTLVFTAALVDAPVMLSRAFQFGQKKFRFDSIRFGNLINLPLVHWYSNSKLGVIFIVCIA